MPIYDLDRKTVIDTILNEFGILKTFDISYDCLNPLESFEKFQAKIASIPNMSNFYLQVRSKLMNYTNLEEKKKAIEHSILIGAFTPFAAFGHAIGYQQTELAFFALEQTLSKPDGFSTTLKDSPLEYLRLAYNFATDTDFKKALSLLLNRVTDAKDLAKLYLAALEAPISENKMECLTRDDGKAMMVRYNTKEEVEQFRISIQDRFQKQLGFELDSSVAHQILNGK